MITRRTLFGLLAAPAVIRIIDLMPVKSIIVPDPWGFGPGEFSVDGWAKPAGGHWSHIALDRAADGLKRYYIDGVRVDALPAIHEGWLSNLANSKVITAGDNVLSLGDLRVTKGIARWHTA